MDNLYDMSYECYENLKYSNIFKCKFELDKTFDEGGRVFNRPEHTYYVPVNDLNTAKISKAKD